MGLYDSFFSQEICPKCKKENLIEFQTKSLLNCLLNWRKGERVSTNNLIIKDGIIREAIGSCPNCNALLIGDIIIKHQRFIKVVNLKVKK